MRPEPRPQRRLYAKHRRLTVWRKSVTLCAAAITKDNVENKTFIHLVFDKQVTLAGGVLSADGGMWKLKRINAKWAVMFAGDASDLCAIRDAVVEVAEKEKKTTF